MDINVTLDCRSFYSVVGIKEVGGSYKLTLASVDGTSIVNVLLSYQQAEHLSDQARDEVGELTFTELDDKMIKMQNRIEDLEIMLEAKQNKIEQLEIKSLGYPF